MNLSDEVLIEALTRRGYTVTQTQARVVTLAGAQAMLKEVVEECRCGVDGAKLIGMDPSLGFSRVGTWADSVVQDRLAVKSLVDALPRCESIDDDPAGNCERPASGHNEDCGAHFRLCDKHSADGPDFNPLPYAAPLRALLDRMNGWE